MANCVWTVYNRFENQNVSYILSKLAIHIYATVVFAIKYYLAPSIDIQLIADIVYAVWGLFGIISDSTVFFYSNKRDMKEIREL